MADTVSGSVARAVLYDFSDRGEPSTLRLLDGTGLILSQTIVRGDWLDGRRVCLAIAGAFGLTLDVVGPPVTVRRSREGASSPDTTLDTPAQYEVKQPAKTEVIKGKATGQCLLF